MKRALVVFGIGLTLLVSCRSKKSSDASAAPSSVSVSSAEPRPPVRRLEPAADVPTEEDFEVEAAREITNQNLEQELDRLEKELQTR